MSAEASHTSLVVLVKDIMSRPDVLARVEEYKSAEPKTDVMPQLVRLMVEFDFPIEAGEFLWQLLKYGKTDYSLIRSGIRVYGDSDKMLEPTGGSADMAMRWHDMLKEESPSVYLVLSPEVKPYEIKDFVDNHWDDLIEPKLLLAGRKVRLRKPRQKPQVNNRIIELSMQGKSDNEIANILNEEFDDVTYTYDLVNKMRNRQKKRDARGQTL